MVQVLIDNATYYLLQYITCYCYCYYMWFLERTMAEIGGNQDAVKMSSMKKCVAYVQTILWSVSAQIAIAHLCQTNAVRPTTLLPEMTQADLEQLTA